MTKRSPGSLAADLIARSERTRSTVEHPYDHALAEELAVRANVFRFRGESDSLVFRGTTGHPRWGVRLTGLPIDIGVSIDLTGDEVATAIDAYLVARGVHVSGPRTITVNGELCEVGKVYVDPSGFVVHEGEKIDGRG